jgi:hypothetical protein
MKNVLGSGAIDPGVCWRWAARYSPLPKRIQLSSTVWEESLNTSDGGRRKNIHFLSEAWVAISDWPFHWSSFVTCSVYHKTKVKTVHSANNTEHCRQQVYQLTRTKHNYTLSQRVLTGTHRLLVTSKGWYDICALQGFYAAWNGNSLPTVRGYHSGPSARGI